MAQWLPKIPLKIYRPYAGAFPPLKQNGKSAVLGLAAAIIGLAPLSLAGASKSVQDAVMNTGLFSRMAIYGVRKEAVLVRPPTASPRTGARSASGSSRPS